MAAPSVFAIGRLRPDGPWVGLRSRAGGYDLLFGERDGALLQAPASRAELLAVAIGYFEESVDDAPPELEATHRDIALVLRWLHVAERDADLKRQLLEVLEGVEDGLAGDVMISRLSRALDGCRTADEQAAPGDLLVGRYRSLSR